MKSNEHSIVRMSAVATLLLLAAVLAWAQSANEKSPAAAPVPAKIGVLNVRQAIVASAEGRQASAELQSTFAPRQNELENTRKQIEDLQKRLRDGDRTLSEDEKARLTRQGELLTRQFQRKQDELQEELNAAQGDVFERIGRKMMDVLDRYARENGYSIVFDTSAQNSPVIYGSSTIEVTQDIIRLYDQANPVKGAPAPASAAPSQAPTTRPPASSQPKTTPPPVQKPPAQKPPGATKQP